MLGHPSVSRGAWMWIPTEDEAVEMYARFLIARHGRAAGRYARGTADRLQSRGDFAGCAIWNRLADTVEQRAAGTDRVEIVMAAS